MCKALCMKMLLVGEKRKTHKRSESVRRDEAQVNEEDGACRFPKCIKNHHYLLALYPSTTAHLADLILYYIAIHHQILTKVPSCPFSHRVIAVHGLLLFKMTRVDLSPLVRAHCSQNGRVQECFMQLINATWVF